MAILRRVFAAAAVFLASCERAPDPFSYTQGDVAVFGVMASGDTAASVVVTEFSPDRGTLGVTGARVTLSSDGMEVQLAAAARCDRFLGAPAGGCYAARLPAAVREGSRWTLRVGLPSGGVVTGTAVVPRGAEVRQPDAGARILVGNHGVIRVEEGRAMPLASAPLAWTAPPGAGRQEVDVRALRPWQGGGLRPDAACGVDHYPPAALDVAGGVARDLVLFEVACSTGGTPAAPAAWDSVDAVLAIAVYDSAYTRFVGEALDAKALRPGRASAGLQGALGVFAGAAVSRVPLRLIAAP